jgi:hypothetical protein
LFARVWSGEPHIRAKDFASLVPDDPRSHMTQRGKREIWTTNPIRGADL